VTYTIKLGISACLLGERVRYDGGHSHDPFLTDTLGRLVEFVAVCPEVECDLGIPREPMRLVGDPASPRLVTIATGRDLTDRMMRFARKRVVELEEEELDGFVFKTRSPSSGVERVKVYNEKGTPVIKGVGIFARVFMEHFPLIPVEDEERLHDPGLREHFIERIFVLKGWRHLMARRPTRGKIADFHSKHRLVVMSHSEKHYRELSRLVAEAKDYSADELQRRYQRGLMDALKIRSNVKKHAKVLFHILGYLKKDLSSEERQEVLEIVEQYLNGNVPLIVPITLLNHFARKFAKQDLRQEYYLNPEPLELRMRNHA
jgi:uncharacterized protein YbgA (DUF1722 family)/uncharacterized protein YbbK (DUF523 family)